MTRQEHLLTIVGEECSEVHKAACKALRFGIHHIEENKPLTTKEKILQEFNDLCAVMEMTFGGLLTIIDSKQIDSKKLKVEKYLKYSEECGTLDI